MMRSIVLEALCVCSVPSTRWPVSAAVSAVAIVSRSRISPTRITSGSWRRRRAAPSAKLGASTPISRWLTMQRLCRCTNSIGSSIVRMCSARVRLTSSIIAASVVDLPEPVGPVTRTRPRGFSASLWSDGGRPSSSSVLIASGMRRKAAPTELALEVDVDAEAGEARDAVREVELPLDLEVLLLLAREDLVQQLLRVLGGQRLVLLEALDWPCTRIAGRVPTLRWRSDALRATICSSSSSIEYVRMPVSPSDELSAVDPDSLNGVTAAAFAARAIRPIPHSGVIPAWRLIGADAMDGRTCQDRLTTGRRRQ